MFSITNYLQLLPTTLLRAIAASALILTLATSSEGFAQSKKSPFADGPRTIASRERVTVLIDREIADGKKYIILKISVPTDSEVKAFLLPDPPRVVVDFEGASIKKSEEFAAPENDVIKQVRLGSHPSKIRFVLDMKRSTPPEYEWKAGKRQAILKFFEGQAEAVAPASPSAAPSVVASAAPATPLSTTLPNAVLPTQAPSAAQTIAPTLAPTMAPATAPKTALPVAPLQSPTPLPTTPSSTSPSATPKTTLSDIEPKAVSDSKGAAGPVGAAPAQAIPADQSKQAGQSLGDIENGPPQPKVPTTFSIKGYKFEYTSEKVPVLKILLNKPQAQAQISKVDEETYKIEIKDCGIDNEELELPQFPPHDFVGFVMVVAETVGKNTEVSISIEEDIVLGTVVNGNEIWVKKP
jgi:hypothetical protein